MSDRAALAARLRDAAAVEQAWLVAHPAFGGREATRVASTARDLLAAADELDRPRPRIAWRIHPGEVEAVLAPFGVVWVGSRRAAMLRIGKLIDAGFDVAPLPEVPRG